MNEETNAVKAQIVNESTKSQRQRVRELNSLAKGIAHARREASKGNRVRQSHDESEEAED